MRRPSTSSDVSVSSGSTLYSFTKEPELDLHEEKQQVQAQAEAQAQVHAAEAQDEEAKKKKRRSLRQRAREMVHDMGTPPTSRHDAKEGKQTPNYAPLGGMMGEPLTRPARI
ncbi:hypothetical protein PT974_11482 [Cladobotryum mycophilum]|uniref:Uncharacterized protein n=1 Tax=Cladobotryum mycophilum TaxID=491253 RepID=A0ABR0S5C4_9HYPO